MNGQLPEYPDLPTARVLQDGLRMSVWTVRGYRHGAQKDDAPARDRFVSRVLLGGSLVMFPLIAIVTPLLIGLRRNTRYYMTPERDAVIAITVGRTTWHIADHSTAHPGGGRGGILRDALVPRLLGALDAAGAALDLVAVNEKMAEAYERDVPGLVRTGRKIWPRGLYMRRPPSGRSG